MQFLDFSLLCCNYLATTRLLNKFRFKVELSTVCNTCYYYMASSVSGQDEPNRALIGYPSGQDGAILPARDYPPYPARKISPKAIISPLLIKLVRSRWLDIGLVLFLVFMDLDPVSIDPSQNKT